MRIRSILFTCLLAVILNVNLHAQPFVIVGTNTSQYPQVVIRAYGFTSAGQLTEIQQSEVSVTQDGSPVTAAVTQEPTTAGRNISVYVCADVSEPARTGTPTALSLMTSAATVVPDIASETNDELALGSYTVTPLLLCGMTANKSTYTDAIKDLKLGTGSRAYPPLMSSPLGALIHLQSARNGRALLLLVNGAQGFDLAPALAMARSFRTQVYVIGVQSTLSNAHKALADSTGGLWIENVTTAADIEVMARAYVAHAKNLPRSVISFTSPAECGGDHNVVIRRGSATGTTAYTASQIIIPTLEWSKSGLDFGTKSESSLQSVTLTARNAPVTITNSQIDDPAFTITTPIAPGTVLQPDQSVTITVRYAGGVDGVFGLLTLATDACNVAPLYLRAASLNSGETLTLLSPNGNETYTAGIDQVITWTNALPSDFIRIEMSRDNGTTWSSITENAQGLSYTWTPGPLTTNQGRIRIQRTTVDENSILVLRGHRDPVYCVDFSRDNRHVFTGGDDYSVRMWNANTGEQERQIGSHQGWVWSISADPTSTRVASGSHDGTVRVWDYETGERLLTIAADSRVWAVDYAPDGSKIVIGSESSVTVVTADSGRQLNKSVVLDGRVQTARFSKDGSKILISSGNKARLIDASSLATIREFTGHTAEIYEGAISPDGDIVVTGGADYTVRSYNANTGALIASTPEATAAILDLDFSSDGMKILVAGGDGTAKIYSTTMTLLNSLAGHAGLVYGGRFDVTGDRVATAATDATARIWTIRNATLSQDVSDGPFRVIGGIGTAVAIDHGTVEVGRGVEKTSAALSNTGTNPLVILSYRITSGNVDDFEVMALSKPDTLDQNDVLNVQTVFTPNGVGPRSATLSVLTGTGMVDVQLRGTGATASLQFPDVVNFGRHVANQSVIDTTITLRSTTTATITRTSLVGVQAGAYQILSGGGTFTVDPSNPRDIRFRFEPVEFGRFAARVELTLSDGTTRLITLYGEGTGDARILSSTPSLLFVTDRCSAAVTEQQLEISNTGTSTLRLFSASIAGASASEFTIVEPASFPVDIAAGAATNFKIRFAPQTAGAKDARLVIASNAIDAENGSTSVTFVARKDSVAFELSTPTMAFNNVPEGQSATQRMLLFNTGTVALRWSANQIDLGDFVIQSIEPSVTSPGGQSEITVRFKGGSVGTVYNGQYQFLDTICGRSQTLFLSATVASYVGFTVKIDTVAGDIGTEVEVPVRILNKVNLDQTNITEVNARISVNGTILTPTGTVTNSTFSPAGIRTFDVVLPIPQSGDVSTNLRFKITWGNDTASYVRVDSLWAADTLFIRNDNGQVNIADLCKEGGPRLFIRTGGDIHQGASVRIAPSPANGPSLVEAYVVENGPTRVDLVDMTGRVVLNLVDRDLVRGTYTLPFDASTLETGAYTIVISTRTQRMSNRFSVVR